MPSSKLPAVAHAMRRDTGNESCKLLDYKNLTQVTKILYTSQTRVPRTWVPGTSVDQGNQCHLQNYGTSSSVNGSEANRMVPAFPYSSFCDSKIFAECVWQSPTSEVAQKGCSLRKGDVLNQISCSRPRHVESQRQWELGSCRRNLTVQLYFPAQRSLRSASQPNKWTWQICYM